MRIGIFGGSFNPVHEGHLKLAAHAKDELNLDKIIFVPSFVTPLKERSTLLPAALRLNLLRKAVKSSEAYLVSDCEFKRKGVSYTVDTLQFFKKKYPRATLFFLAGADVVKNLSRWKSIDRVMKLCRFVVTDRPRHNAAASLTGFLSTNSSAAASIIFMPFGALNISSSEIRSKERIA